MPILLPRTCRLEVLGKLEQDVALQPLVFPSVCYIRVLLALQSILVVE
jgi:hypothetical protein